MHKYGMYIRDYKYVAINPSGFGGLFQWKRRNSTQSCMLTEFTRMKQIPSSHMVPYPSVQYAPSMYMQLSI